MPDASTLIQQINQADLAIQRRLAEMYADALEAVLREHAAFARWVKQQKEKGAPVSPSWASREARYLSLQSQLYQAVQKYGGGSAALLQAGISPAVIEALKSTVDEAKAGAPVVPGLTYPGFGPETWALINKAAIAAAEAFLTHVESPLKQLLERDLPETAVSVFRKEWRAGLLSGKNPNDIARAIAKRIGTLTLGRAQLIARTEFHRAYREGKREQIRRSDVIAGWTWRAALDGRTCVVCYAMHGTFHTADETLDGHPACRCSMVPRTKSWEELGLGGIGDTRRPIELGADRFARLPADMQLAKLGPSRYKLYQEGMPLESMIGTRHSPLWGPMKVLEPLRNVRK